MMVMADADMVTIPRQLIRRLRLAFVRMVGVVVVVVVVVKGGTAEVRMSMDMRLLHAVLRTMNDVIGGGGSEAEHQRRANVRAGSLYLLRPSHRFRRVFGQSAFHNRSDRPRPSHRSGMSL